MTDRTTKLQSEVARASQAKMILENPLFVDAVREIEKRIRNEWLFSDPKEIEKREWLHQMSLANVKFVQVLTKYLQTGNMADTELKKDAAERRTVTRKRQ